jgi:hypothetical protein
MNDENMNDNGTAKDATSFLNKMEVCRQGRFLYALPRFDNYLTEHNKNQNIALLKNAKRWQFINADYTLG